MPRGPSGVRVCSRTWTGELDLADVGIGVYRYPRVTYLDYQPY